MNKKELQALLLEPGHISAKDFDDAYSMADGHDRSMVDILIEKGLIKDSEFGKLFAKKINLPFVILENKKIGRDSLNVIPESLARYKRIVIFDFHNNVFKVAMNNPDDLEARHSLAKRVGGKIEVYYATKADIEKALWQYRNSLDEEMSRILLEFEQTDENSSENNQCIIDLVDTLLLYAQNYRASDIHVALYSKHAVVRFRIDGIMHRVATFPRDIFPFVITRIKILAKMKIDEHMSAQDGKFQFNMDNKQVDVRVSIVPVSGGENLVLRLLSNENRQMGLYDLGINSPDLVKIKKAIKNPHGMVLVTGPTGSGKTTSVYEIIKSLNTERVHIATIEDPVEYNIEGISQIQVNPKARLTFSHGLRAIVRQDPDIIMVGEIRDKETAAIAVNSAMTGHLVLSTLHTNDAATALLRLLDMEIKSFLVASTVNAIVAQRLLRLVCDKCKQPYLLSKEEISTVDMMGSMRELIENKYNQKLEEITFYKGAGCNFCSDSGYKGRIGSYEVLLMSDNVKRLITNQASAGEIMKQAKLDGMTTMLEDGIAKVKDTSTTIDEVIRVIME